MLVTAPTDKASGHPARKVRQPYWRIHNDACVRRLSRTWVSSEARNYLEFVIVRNVMRRLFKNSESDQPAFQQAIKLSDLANEVIDNVALELIDEDVIALHAANGVLFHKTKYAYVERYIEKVHVFLHPVSFYKLER